MYVLRIVVLAAALLLPTQVRAAAIVDLQFSTLVDTESISLGLEPFEWSGPLGFAGLESGTGIDFDHGSITLISGPLLNLFIDTSRTIYTYGPGALLIEAFWGAERGTFTAVTEAFELRVCEGCDTLFGGSLADDFLIPLQAGRFDRAFARALGVSSRTSGGEADFGLEAIDGDPSSSTRTAFDHRGAAFAIVPAVVPEPSLLALCVLAGTAWTALVRRRSASRGMGPAQPRSGHARS